MPNLGPNLPYKHVKNIFFQSKVAFCGSEVIRTTSYIYSVHEITILKNYNDILITQRVKITQLLEMGVAK